MPAVRLVYPEFNVLRSAGKTYFLIYALIRSLHDRKPVAFCFDASRFLYFDQNGGHSHPYDARVNVNFSPNTLALFDSNPALHTPLEPFVSLRSTAYIVQAISASPSSAYRSSWAEWARQKEAEVWVMDAWHEAEMRAFRCELAHQR